MSEELKSESVAHAEERAAFTLALCREAQALAFRYQDALQVIRDMPLPEQDNLIASNMRTLASDALSGKADAGLHAREGAEREAFEKWAANYASAEFGAIDLEHDGATYRKSFARLLWDAWQAHAAFTHPGAGQRAAFCRSAPDAAQLVELLTAAQVVVDRWWEQPLWKDVPATAGYIYRLRDAIASAKTAEGAEK